jgi:putative endonuclease
MGDKTCAVYILTNPNRTVLYTGVTSNLPKRIWEHKNHLDPEGFSARYNAVILVWYETGSDIRAAIALEKRIKAGSRAKKMERIEAMNPAWRDLSQDWK